MQAGKEPYQNCTVEPTDNPDRFAMRLGSRPVRRLSNEGAEAIAVADFLRFAPVAGLGSLAEIRSIHVSAYIEDIGERYCRRRSSCAWRRGVVCSIGWRAFPCWRPTRRRRCEGLHR